MCTFNVRYDNPNDTIKWHERKKEVALAMRYFDIVGAQEVLPNQYDDLKFLMPKHDAFGTGRDEGGTGEACPVFWNAERFDFLQGETRWLSLDPKQEGSVGWDADLPRIATLVVLFDRKRQQTVRVINTHWSHVGEEARLNAAALVAGWSGWDGEASDELVVVCGDLNAEPQTAPVQNLMASADLVDTYDAARYRCRKSFGTYTTFFRRIWPMPRGSTTSSTGVVRPLIGCVPMRCLSTVCTSPITCPTTLFSNETLEGTSPNRRPDRGRRRVVDGQWPRAAR